MTRPAGLAGVRIGDRARSARRDSRYWGAVPGEPGQHIDTDIASLVKKGLDQRVQRALDVVRVVGNNAVHPGKLDVKDDRRTATALFGLVNLIAERTITEPRHVQELYDSLPEGVRDHIERRDGKP